VYEGKAPRCLPQVDFPDGWHVTYSSTHWCNESIMQDYVDEIILLSPLVAGIAAYHCQHPPPLLKKLSQAGHTSAVLFFSSFLLFSLVSLSSLLFVLKMWKCISPCHIRT